MCLAHVDQNPRVQADSPIYGPPGPQFSSPFTSYSFLAFENVLELEVFTFHVFMDTHGENAEYKPACKELEYSET